MRMVGGLVCLAGDAQAHPCVALSRHPCLTKPLQNKPNLHPLFNRSDLARVVQNQKMRKSQRTTPSVPLLKKGEATAKAKALKIGLAPVALALAFDVIFVFVQHE